MSGVNHKYFRKCALAIGMMLILSGASTAQVPPQPPAPPPPPPVVNTPPPIETSDNESNRRRSALVSCCLRRGEGLGAYCSIAQLDAAVKMGDLIRRENSDGSLYCAEGTGTVVSQGPAIGGIDTGQALASPFELVEDAEYFQGGPIDLLRSVLEYLFGPTTSSRL